MGSPMALAIIRQIAGFGQGAGPTRAGRRRLLVDAMGMRFQEVGY
jgi:hypothetical protein